MKRALRVFPVRGARVIGSAFYLEVFMIRTSTILTGIVVGALALSQATWGDTISGGSVPTFNGSSSIGIGATRTRATNAGGSAPQIGIGADFYRGGTQATYNPPSLPTFSS